MMGSGNQYIKLCDTCSINSVRFVNDKSGTNFQWTKNCSDINGATNADHIFANLKTADNGKYKCSIDVGTQYSRTITVGDTSGSGSVRGLLIGNRNILLSQNYPNPFNSVTNFDVFM